MSGCKEIEVGGFAYEAYSPAKVGRVVAVIPLDNGGGVCRARIKTIKGEYLELLAPMNLEALIEDHRRKYERHLATLEALKGMP